MNIIQIENRTTLPLEKLLDLWQASVEATHHFLSAEEIAAIRPYVPEAFKGVEHLFLAKEDGEIVGFMGINGTKLEMLFIAPEKRGKGIGKTLLQHAVVKFGVNSLTVNEQNPQAVGFYQYMGFQTVERHELDEQGNPYPILIMKK
ncbi:GNAT family N-acetyltransferase [Gallibacterium anatis]|uniref:GNAT family N-acetyltransferase n=1 Tax=Gallibacterium anatis TaxID=750 RepID=A0A921L2J6_9PAST|nr:GNAT family N-acetyltransferase [Gallibacterium anatis]MBP4133231.1 GNAT family N-acetyltransferase [Gallibacterium anatis]HJF75112.1 GNAT family N-acetyltransferase [Gallibacterium anatis]